MPTAPKARPTGSQTSLNSRRSGKKSPEANLMGKNTAQKTSRIGRNTTQNTNLEDEKHEADTGRDSDADDGQKRQQVNSTNSSGLPLTLWDETGRS